MEATEPPAAPPSPGRAGVSAGRRIPPWILPLGTAVAALIALLSWGIATPVGSTPDDDFHMPSIWCAPGTETGRCELSPKGTDFRRVPGLLSEKAICYRSDGGATSGRCQERQAPKHLVATDRGNWDHSYPPLYYRTMSLFVFDRAGESILLIRGVNALLAVGLLGALWWALPRKEKPLAVVPMAVMSVPLITYFIPSTNPSTWTITGCAALLPALWALPAASRKRGVALSVIAVVSALLAAGARTDGALFVLMTVGLVGLMRFREYLAAPLRLVAPALSALVGAGFFLSAGQSSVLAGDITTLDRDIGTFDLLAHNFLNMPDLLLGAVGLGSVGMTGWLDTRFSSLPSYLVLGVWAAMITVGLRAMTRAKAVGVTLVALSLLVYPLFILGQVRAVVGEMMQARYMLPLLIMLTATALLGADGVAARLSRRSYLLAVGVLSFAHAVVLHMQIRRYVTGLDVTGFNLSKNVEWWWPHIPGPMAMWVIGSIAFSVAVAGVLSTVRASSRAVAE
ncbi:DUF2142 domain-containing protein [Nocardioides albidus]|uniref:DUF2142 domain-containing protein n=1 Tax=Nocardioides albidus TaxID=1517589 RepID=A0A5C4W592_9ACTN|nr:DUF2142 domain-containing protein [Nocardioides albidus]TNM42766.1 DUF2142 domain-containing protein [Nocardioides albidus]